MHILILIALDEVEEAETLAVVIKVTFDYILILIALGEVAKAGHSLLDSR